MEKFINFILILSILFMGAGCAYLAIGAIGAAGGATYVAYIKGEMEYIYGSPYDKVWDSITVSLKQLEIRIGEEEKTSSNGKITAYMKDGVPVYITVNPLSSDSTSVKVRVGTFGDRRISELIHSQIYQNLRAR